MDKYTFGNTKAAIKLVEILTELNNSNVTGKVGLKLGRFSQMLNELSKVDTSVSIAIGKIVYDKFSQLDNNLPTTVNSFTRNLIQVRYKSWMLENNGSMGKKYRVELLKDK